MNLREAINGLLRPSGYEIAKTYGSQASLCLNPGDELDAELILERISSNRKHVWVVAPPKSGSTWLTVLLGQLLGWPMVPLVNGYDRREQEIHLLPLLRYPDIDILSPHQHCRASEPTTDFIKRFNVQTIVVTRNVFDSVVSMRDHLLNESLAMSMAYVDEKFLGWPEERQSDFIIEMFTPWFLSFYTSWFSVDPDTASHLMFVSYEDLAARTEETLARLLAFIGESRTATEIRRTIECARTSNTRRNKAVAGRGNLLLSQRQTARIKELRQFYDHLDFSSVGL